MAICFSASILTENVYYSCWSNLTVDCRPKKQESLSSKSDLIFNSVTYLPSKPEK